MALQTSTRFDIVKYVRSDDDTRTLATSHPPEARFKTYRLRMSSMGGAEQTLEVQRPLFRVGSEEGSDLVIDDAAVSRIHLQITVEPTGFRLRDLGSRNGTFVDGYRASDIHLRAGARIALGRTEMVFEPLETEVALDLAPEARFGPLVGGSPAMRALFATLGRIASTDLTVLVEGPTGTGKEVVAQALHEGGTRAGQPFIVFDCSAVPAGWMERLLFGEKDGTGDNAGAFGQAEGGTLVLDEIGELPSELQKALLRAIDAREIRPVGALSARKVDVRMVAGTHRDLAEEVNRGSFRNDLYHRLAVLRLLLPPLADRSGDVRVLAEHFVREGLRDDPQRADRLLSSVPAATWHRLDRYHFPGNVRELRNIVDRGLALASEGVLDLTPGLVTEPAEAKATAEPNLEEPFLQQRARLVSEFEEAYVSRMLERYEGNFSRAAAAAGLDRMYFKRILKRYS